jgi:hypothetical protein
MASCTTQRITLGMLRGLGSSVFPGFHCAMLVLRNRGPSPIDGICQCAFPILSIDHIMLEKPSTPIASKREIRIDSDIAEILSFGWLYYLDEILFQEI